MKKTTKTILGTRIAIAGEGLGLFKGKTVVAAITNLATTVIIEDIVTEGINVCYGPPFERTLPSLDSVGAIVRTLQKRQHTINNIRVSITSNVPIGQGLASSSVLLSALASCFNRHLELGYGVDQLIDIAWEAERIDQGIVCDKFDHYAIFYKGALLQDFGQDPARIQPFSLPLDTIVVIGTTGIPTPYGVIGASIRDRFAAQDPLVHAYRNLMKFSTDELVVAAKSDDKKRIGELISLFHNGIRNYLKIENSQINMLVETALLHGAYASKMCSLRFHGGSMFAFCTKDTAQKVADAIEQKGARAHIVSVAYP
ncbi:MAG: hypothetical protein Q8P56_02450 [Candidatus Uhrbacteria bacterium]|nr:hypothetical protein [Candidatus Uhrbacteria bacterium]